MSDNRLVSPLLAKHVLSKRYPTLARAYTGNFYSQKYLNQWIRIAELLPEVRFYATTKSFQLDWSRVPSNMIILQSYGSRFDDKIDPTKNTARVIDSKSEVRKGEFLCPYHESFFLKCGETCAYCFSDYPKVKHVCYLRH